MCKVLQVSRSMVYRSIQEKKVNYQLIEAVKQLFEDNQCVYGSRKLKAELLKKGKQVSRRQISRIMKQEGLVSVYTRKKYKAIKKAVNEGLNDNLVERQFNGKDDYEVMV